MENEADGTRKRGYVLRRAILDYGMGIVIFGFGVFFLLGPKLGYDFGMGPLKRYLFSGLFLLYGGFRIYRGAKKNYFN